MRHLLFFGIFLIAFHAFPQRELWGTVSNGGQFGHGYLFKTDAAGDNLVIVHHFDSVNGRNPGALLAASNNKLYGLTASGGQNASSLFSGGVLFEYDLVTSTFAVVEHFGPANTSITGYFPAGDGKRTLTEAPSGLIYGQLRAAYQGGVIFAYNTATETISTALTLPTFQGGTTNETMGNRLEGTLYAAPDGYLYGTTHTNSQCPIPNPNLGSIIRIDPATNAFSIRYLAPCLITYGYQFESWFTTYGSRFYSVTKPGGANNFGVIYAFDPATNAYTNLYDFEGGLLGKQPTHLVAAANGKFYGTADGGTPEQNLPDAGGILFEFDPDTEQFTKKLDFLYADGSYLNVGPYPFSLIAATNGKLYGVTSNGVFEYDPALNATVAKGRFPIGMGWYPAATPSLTAVCRKPSYVAFGDTSITACAGSNVSIALESDNTTGYTWLHDGVADSSQASSQLSFGAVTAADAGTWTGILSNECGTTAGPAIAIVVQSVGAPLVTQVGAELHATNAPAYQWIDCANDLPVNGATEQVFAPSVNGSYAVIALDGACSDTSECYILANLGLSAQGNTHFLLFPNPATTEIRLLANSTADIVSVTVLGTNGQIVLRSSSTVLNIAGLESGSYFVIAETTAGPWHGRFVKTRD